MNREQIIKALELHSQRGACMDKCPYGKENLCGNAMARDALSLIRELTEENEKLKYTSLTSITMEQALTRIRRLQREKEEIVHKTIARVKIKCQRVSYADMAVPGVTHEIFTIKGEDLDEIEKELLEGEKCLSK